MVSENSQVVEESDEEVEESPQEVFTTIEGDMSAALSQVPALIEIANAKWDSSPRNPKADLPEPPPSTTPARSQSAPPSKKAQPSFF